MALGPGVGSLRWACTFHALGDANSTRRKPVFWWNMGFRLNNKVNDKKKTSKYIENKCSHRAFRPILIGKPANAREILSMFELGRKPSQVILGVFFDRK